MKLQDFDIKIEENENYERIDDPLPIDGIAQSDNNDHDVVDSLKDL